MTLRHELFCQEYANCLDESKAMRAVGLKPRSPSLLDSNQEVQERVAELVRQRLARIQLSGDWILIQLSKNAEAGRERGDLANSNAALKFMAELLGLTKQASTGKPIAPSTPYGFGGASNGSNKVKELARSAEHDEATE